MITSPDDLPASLSTTVLRDLCDLSGLVYEPWDHIEAVLGSAFVAPYDAGDSQAMLVRRPRYSVIVFRGTELSRGRLSDVLANFGWASPWPGTGRVHSGYARQLTHIFAALVAMSDRAASGLPLYATGHSMGGALATLYAARVGRASRRRLDAVVTFGAPRAAQSSAYAGLRAPVARVVNAGDFAPGWGWWLFSHPPGAPLVVDSGGPRDGYERHRVESYRAALADL